MISESAFTPQQSSGVAPTWALSVFRVEDHVAQQRVLRALRRLGRADVTAMGTRRGSETFVVIDWDCASDGFPPPEVVLTADRRATTMFTSRREGALP